MDKDLYKSWNGYYYKTKYNFYYNTVLKGNDNDEIMASIPNSKIAPTAIAWAA